MSTRRPVLRHRVGQDVATPAWRADSLAVEEPLEIRLGTEPYTVTMRTPGHDLDLALGFLVGEGVVTAPGDVVSARHCPDTVRGPDGEPTHNVVEVVLAPTVAAPAITRHRHVSSACGICGVQSIEDVRSRTSLDVRTDRLEISAEVLATLPDRLRAEQRTFARTGGVHAAALFTPEGEVICVREDVGRHNAVDKVVGWALQAGRLPLRNTLLQVSGRASFELVQKALTAGCPLLCAVSAPSSLAVDLAADAGMTLVGFARGTSFNIYAAPQRIPG